MTKPSRKDNRKPYKYSRHTKYTKKHINNKKGNTDTNKNDKYMLDMIDMNKIVYDMKDIDAIIFGIVDVTLDINNLYFNDISANANAPYSNMPNAHYNNTDNTNINTKKVRSRSSKPIYLSTDSKIPYRYIDTSKSSDRMHHIIHKYINNTWCVDTLDDYYINKSGVSQKFKTYACNLNRIINWELMDILKKIKRLHPHIKFFINSEIKKDIAVDTFTHFTDIFPTEHIFGPTVYPDNPPLRNSHIFKTFSDPVENFTLFGKCNASQECTTPNVVIIDTSPHILEYFTSNPIYIKIQTNHTFTNRNTIYSHRKAGKKGIALLGTNRKIPVNLRVIKVLDPYTLAEKRSLKQQYLKSKTSRLDKFKYTIKTMFNNPLKSPTDNTIRILNTLFHLI